MARYIVSMRDVYKASLKERERVRGGDINICCGLPIDMAISGEYA